MNAAAATDNVVVTGDDNEVGVMLGGLLGPHRRRFATINQLFYSADRQHAPTVAIVEMETIKMGRSSHYLSGRTDLPDGSTIASETLSVFY